MKTRVDTRRLQQIIRTNPQFVEDVGRMAASEMVSEIKLGMQQSPASGETYRRGSITHVASEPGKPPRPDTGTLMGSIKWLKVRDGEWQISDGVEYGLYLELGTETIAPRPFMAPVFEEWRRKHLVTMIHRQAQRRRLI